MLHTCDSEEKIWSDSVRMVMESELRNMIKMFSSLTLLRYHEKSYVNGTMGSFLTPLKTSK
jgi:hypothetical protein